MTASEGRTMQIGGIGSEHNTHTHNVTNCIHESPATKKPEAGAMHVAQTGAQQAQSQAAQGGDNAFSLSGFLDRYFRSTKKLFGRIWGGSGEKDSGTAQELVDEQETASLAVLAMPASEWDDRINNNPFFTPVTDNMEPPRSIARRVRYKVRRVAGQLAKRFSFLGSGKNSLGAEKREKREDLRRRSHYREDDVEIECVITDDSYLLDSYDRKGEYSKLSTKL